MKTSAQQHRLPPTGHDFLKRICRAAASDPRTYLTLVLVDEINRGDVPKIFTERITFLESADVGVDDRLKPMVVIRFSGGLVVDDREGSGFAAVLGTSLTMCSSIGPMPGDRPPIISCRQAVVVANSQLRAPPHPHLGTETSSTLRRDLSCSSATEAGPVKRAVRGWLQPRAKSR